MKQFFFVLLFFFASIGAGFAQSTITHTIQRGETLESIAKKYGISVEQLRKANPDTNEFFYVGMKLLVPKVSTPNNNDQTQVIRSIHSQSIKSEESKQHYYANNGTDSNNPNIITDKKHTISSQNIEDNRTIGQDIHLLYQSEAKSYGIEMGLDIDKNIVFDWGLASNLKFDRKSTSVIQAFFGLGAKQRYVFSESFLLNFRLFPYAGFSQISQPKNVQQGIEGNEKTEFIYGASFDVQIGIKLWNTPSGNSYFLSAGYKLDAFEFKTKGLLKNGGVMIGLSWTFNFD